MTAPRPVWVLRPEPGNSATCARIADMGRVGVAMPLFTVEPVAWELPDPDQFDALLLTSANAVRHAGKELVWLTTLPVYAVGDATARAAKAAGLAVSATGDGGVDEIAPILARDGRRRILHLTGHDFRMLPLHANVTTRQVYAALDCAEGDLLPALYAAPRPADVLIHSPRAAKRFAKVVDMAKLSRQDFRLFTLSPAIADAAGAGWMAVHVAPSVNEAALLSCLSK